MATTSKTIKPAPAPPIRVTPDDDSTGLTIGHGSGTWGQYKLPFFYILPAFLVLALVTFYPIGYQIWMSFTNFTSKNLRGKPPAYVGVDNFRRILTNDLGIANYNFYRLLLFNLTWTLVNVVLHVAIGVAVAVLLNRSDIIGKKFFRAAYIIPWAMPPLVVAVVWRNMFDPQYGAINLLLASLHLPNHTNWLTSPNNPIPFLSFLPVAFYAVLLVNVWLGWPFMMVVATGALQSIPGDLYEAARIDGATRNQQFWDITAPLLRPAMVPAIMYGSILTFNQFNVIYFITAGGPAGRTEILVTQAYRLVSEQRLYGVASAFSIIIFFILLVITLAQNKVLRGLEAA
jgi:arabinogalactan oligomer/maltooligosaccharide transport system permease protein